MNEDINNIVDISLIEKQWREMDNLRGHGQGLYPHERVFSQGEEVLIQSHILLATILYQIKEIKKIDKLLYIDGGTYFNREFLLSKIPHDHIQLHFPYEINTTQEADLVFGNFPFGVRRRPADLTPSKDIRGIDLSTQRIIDCVDAISEDGVGLFLTLSYFRTFERDDLRKHLGSKGVFVNGIINLPKDFTHPVTSLQSLLILVSRAKTDKEFILNIDSSSTYDFNLENLFNGIDSDDVSIGSWVSSDDFHGFEVLEITKELNSVGGDYSNFSTRTLEQVCKEINLVKTGGAFEEKEDTVYLPLIGIQEAVTNIGDIPIKHQNVAQLVVDNKKVIPEYVCVFLNSKIGKALLKIEKERQGGVIPRITKFQLMEFPLSVPELITIQEQVVDTMRKYRFIQETVNKLGENLTLNPVSDTDTSETIDLVMKSVGELSRGDQIADLIRRGESKTTEFKQTFCFDIRTKKRESYITDGIIKTIAAFLNTEGGTLLVGISDSKEITGMKDEMEKFFKQGGPDLGDNLIKHLKNLIKTRIGEEFYPLIDTELIPIKSEYVLRIDCKHSDTAVYVKPEDFYVRAPASTDKLEGQKMVEYIKRRFWANR